MTTKWRDIRRKSDARRARERADREARRGRVVIGLILGACAAVLLAAGFCAGPAEADGRPIWHWVDRHGTYCWTDDKDQVPRAYLASAEATTLGRLADYDQYTKAPQHAAPIPTRSTGG